MSTKFLYGCIALSIFFAMLVACGQQTTPAPAAPKSVPTQDATPVYSPTRNPNGVRIEQATGSNSESVNDSVTIEPYDAELVKKEILTGNVKEGRVSDRAFQMIACPKTSAIKYAANTSMTGLKFGCSDDVPNAGYFQVSKTKTVTVLLKVEGKKLVWSRPEDLKCSATFTDNLSATGSIDLATAFPNGYIPGGTGFNCVSQKNIVIMAMFGWDTPIKQ